MGAVESWGSFLGLHTDVRNLQFAQGGGNVTATGIEREDEEDEALLSQLQVEYCSNQQCLFAIVCRSCVHQRRVSAASEGSFLLKY